MSSAEEKEMRELLANARPKTIDIIWKLLRHMNGQKLPAADMDELRAVIDRHGFNRADFNLS